MPINYDYSIVSIMAIFDRPDSCNFVRSVISDLSFKSVSNSSFENLMPDFYWTLGFSSWMTYSIIFIISVLDSVLEMSAVLSFNVLFSKGGEWFFSITILDVFTFII